MSAANTHEILPRLFQGLAGAALAVLALWAIAAIFGWRQSEQLLPGTEKARALARYEIKREIDEAALALDNLAWIDEAAGTVQLPIEKAMDLTARELRAKSSGPSGVTVQWIAPLMPDYSKPAGEAAPVEAASGDQTGAPAEGPVPAAVEPAVPATEPAPTAPAGQTDTAPAGATLPEPSRPGTQNPMTEEHLEKQEATSPDPGAALPPPAP